MTPLAPSIFPVPALIAVASNQASAGFLDFFTANIRTKHARRASAQAAWGFLAWRQRAGVAPIADVQP